MATKVEMPQMGESVVEGTILTWLKKEGDTVEVDEPLVEVSTDKVDTEIPSPVAGTLVKILVQEGETVEIGTALAEVDESAPGEGAPSRRGRARGREGLAGRDARGADGEEAGRRRGRGGQDGGRGRAGRRSRARAGGEGRSVPPRSRRLRLTRRNPPRRPRRNRSRRPRRPTPAASAAPASDNGPGQALSPLVRRLAREHNVDIAKVRGTGAGGRVTRDDVLAFVESGAAAGRTVRRESGCRRTRGGTRGGCASDAARGP